MGEQHLTVGGVQSQEENPNISSAPFLPGWPSSPFARMLLGHSENTFANFPAG